jgi:hypothetical protein
VRGVMRGAVVGGGGGAQIVSHAFFGPSVVLCPENGTSPVLR